ncbi:hypothetical protein ADUPG1_004394 [Aduncisulcus paluster]|uniref:Uncharacterized protein n=1 Tax=Aduncisulcus paluster TaxID=2918883 RepID=A0ABQ5K1L7_9EUKA|nr:hypothetical protein ADUPG1_004394 [Aduncisulcus paluster]
MFSRSLKHDGAMWRPVLSMSLPRYSTFSWANTHLEDFILMLKDLHLSKTFSNLLLNSSMFSAAIRMSSMYIMHTLSLIKSSKASYTLDMKAFGAVATPKGITVYWYVPNGVMKAVSFCDSFVSLI